MWPPVPDNSRIGYTMTHGGSGASVWTTLPTGAGSNVQIATVDGDPYPHIWSPDASRVAFRAALPGDTSHQVFTALPTAATQTIVVSNVQAGGGVPVTFGFQWTADGARLVYRADQDTIGVQELYATHPTGAGAIVKLSGAIEQPAGRVISFLVR